MSCIMIAVIGPLAVPTISIACGAHHGMRLKVPVAGAVPAASPSHIALCATAPWKALNDELGAIPRSSSDGQRAKTLTGHLILHFICLWRCMNSLKSLFAPGCLASGIINNLLDHPPKYAGLIWPAVIHSLPFTNSRRI